MKRLILIGAVLLLPACTTAAVPPPSTQLARFQACSQEADWVTLHADAYRYASPRTREQVSNAGDPGANATRALCRALFLDTKADDRAALNHRCDTQIVQDQQRFGALANEHDRRIKAFCDTALNNQAVVSGG